jgi:hypothetical protein
MHVRFTFTVANHQTETHFAFAMENVKQQIRAQILGDKFHLQLQDELRLHLRGEQFELASRCCAAFREKHVFSKVSARFAVLDACFRSSSLIRATSVTYDSMCAVPRPATRWFSRVKC